jgi:hypothetical protein
MDSDVSLGRIWITAARPSHAGHASSQRQRFQTRGGFPIQGRYTLFGTGIRRIRSLRLLSRNSFLHDCETRGCTGHELHSSPNPHRDSSDPRVQPLACVRQAGRSSIERAACALGHILGRRRWHWAAFGSRAEQSRADLQSRPLEQQIGHSSQAAAINRTCALSRCGYGQWRRSSPRANLPHFVLLGVVTGLGFLQAETFLPFLQQRRDFGRSSLCPLYLNSCDCRFQRPTSP